MTANPLDRKSVAIFKALRKGGANSGKANHDFRELRSRIADASLGHDLDDLFGDFSAAHEPPMKRTADAMFRTLESLRDQGFVELVALLFSRWGDTLAAQKLERIQEVATNAAALEIWRKSALMPVKELETRLLKDPEATYATVGGDWLLVRTKPAKLSALLEMYLSKRSRPKHLPAWADALSAALKKDKGGILLATMLNTQSDGGEGIAALAEVVRLDRTLLKTTLDQVTRIISRKDLSVRIAEFIDWLFKGILETDGSNREFYTGALARLGSEIVVGERGVAQEGEVLEVIAKYSRQLRNLREDESLAAHTWVFENLLPQGENVGGRLHVTLDGARDVALAFQKVAQGFEALEVLKVTARNLGLVPIGKKGDAIAYNPLQHQDLDGGMLPGDPGIVEDVGWAHGNDVVLRAKVRKGGVHV